MVHVALEAAANLAKNNIQCEAIDLHDFAHG
jgi:transketolase C-terminal domain/subunit